MDFCSSDYFSFIWSVRGPPSSLLPPSVYGDFSISPSQPDIFAKLERHYVSRGFLWLRWVVSTILEKKCSHFTPVVITSYWAQSTDGSLHIWIAYRDKMEAFVGKFERTSADKYEEMLKVDGRGTATECREWESLILLSGAGSQFPSEKSCHSINSR